MDLIIAVVRAVGSIVVTGTQLVSSGIAMEEDEIKRWKLLFEAKDLKFEACHCTVDRL